MEALNNNTKKSIHFISAHSYALYFLLLLVGVTLDLTFKFKLLTNGIMMPAGLILIVLATMWILWTEHTSRNFKKGEVTPDSFSQGPYRYTKSPNHWGLLMLILGFGMVSNAFFVVLATILSFIIGKFVLEDWKEKILEEKYGPHYAEYKKSVKF